MRLKKEWLFGAAGIFALALAVRLAFIAMLGGAAMIYDSLHDQYTYIDLAKSLVGGRGYSMSFSIFVADAGKPTAIQPPVYPLVLAGIFSVFGESYLAVRILQALASAATCVVVYWIARDLLGQAVARTTAIILCVYPLLVMYTRPIMPETIYTLLVALIVWLIVQIALGRSRQIHFAALGLLFGLAFLTRPEILLLAPMAALFGYFWTWRKKQHTLRHISIGAGVGALAFLLTISPWVIRNQVALGEPQVFPSKRWGLWAETWLRNMRDTQPNWAAGCENELKCAIPNFEQMTELERDAYAAQLASNFLRENPGLYIRYAQSRFFRSYPLIPREELPPPLGYKGERVRPQDGYHPTALDEIPLYLRGLEKLRVWSFRLLFAIAIGGLVLGLRQRRWNLLVAALPVAFSLVFSILLSGTERYRMPFDPFIILVAAYAIVGCASAVRGLVLARQRDLVPAHEAR